MTSFTRRCAAFSILASAALCCAGCSNQQLYESIQHANMQECEENPEFRREKCLRRVSEPYEQYEEDRRAIMKEAE